MTSTTSGDKNAAQPGPWTDKDVTTYKVSGLEVTITRHRESSHVPPADPPCGCGDKSTDYIKGADFIIGALKPWLLRILDEAMKARFAAEGSAPPPDEPGDSPEP